MRAHAIQYGVGRGVGAVVGGVVGLGVGECVGGTVTGLGARVWRGVGVAVGAGDGAALASTHLVPPLALSRGAAPRAAGSAALAAADTRPTVQASQRHGIRDDDKVDSGLTTAGSG